MKLGILISTINEGIETINRRADSKFSLCQVYVHHQITDKQKYSLGDEHSFFYSTSDNSGLSKSRNQLLNLTEETVNLFADDDVEYLSGFEEKILKAHKEYPEADVIAFRIKERNFPFKHSPFIHNAFSIGKVSSVTISFKLNSIIKNNIVFDENFGLGTDVPFGEENVFLKDCLDAGLKVISINTAIVSHSHESSGEVLSRDKFLMKVEVLKRMHGFFITSVYILYFAFFKYRVYREHVSFSDFIFSSYKRLLKRLHK